MRLSVVQKVAILVAIVPGIYLRTSRPSFAAEAKLSGRIGNYSAYFLGPNRLRHHRYELHLKQVATYSSRINSVIEGRWRYDATLQPQANAPYHDIDRQVRADEMAEGEVRQFYVDYLGEAFRLTIGLQQIDWVDTLSPLGNDCMTPLDLRHGGFGAASEVLVPVGAARLNHQFIAGSLDWLIVPQPKHSRLPAAANGYGLFEMAARHGIDIAAIKTEEMPKTANQTEGGLRYLLGGEGWDLTLLGYRGHHKTPVFASRFATEPYPHYETTGHYPLSPTYGLALATAGDAWVFRLAAFYEPSRTPAQQLRAPTAQASPSQVSEIREVRSKLGLGFDYVFSQHLKLYSEQYVTRTEIVGQDAGTTILSQDDRRQDDYTATLRLTNETLDSVLLACDALFTSPDKSHVLMPHLTWTLREVYELELGARLIKSMAERSRFEPLKQASHIYVSVFRHLTTGS